MSLVVAAGERDAGANAESPFLPGIAGVPPHLAGRERQQAALEKQLDRLGRGTPPKRPAVLFGPRGNGKTALLHWLRQQALDRGINTLEVLTAEVRTEEEFVNRFSPTSWWRSMIESISVQGTEVQLRERGATRLSSALAKLVKKRPAILLVDEAHMLEPALGKLLLQATLALYAAGKPFQLVLAGTPSLQSHLCSMGATFWERSLVLSIRRLDPQESSDAIRIPLESGKRSIAGDALERVVQESNGYPYFLQIWGELLWEAADATARPLGMDDVNSLYPQFVDTRDGFYLERYLELKRSALLASAVVLSEAFEGRDSLEDSEVDDVLMRGLAVKSGTSEPVDVAKVRDKLHDLGYIWAPGGSSGKKYYPGIPSLMSFVADTPAR